MAFMFSSPDPYLRRFANCRMKRPNCQFDLWFHNICRETSQVQRWINPPYAANPTPGARNQCCLEEIGIRSPSPSRTYQGPVWNSWGLWGDLRRPTGWNHPNTNLSLRFAMDPRMFVTNWWRYNYIQCSLSLFISLSDLSKFSIQPRLGIGVNPVNAGWWSGFAVIIQCLINGYDLGRNHNPQQASFLKYIHGYCCLKVSLRTVWASKLGSENLNNKLSIFSKYIHNIHIYMCVYHHHKTHQKRFKNA